MDVHVIPMVLIVLSLQAMLSSSIQLTYNSAAQGYHFSKGSSVCHYCNARRCAKATRFFRLCSKPFLLFVMIYQDGQQHGASQKIHAIVMHPVLCRLLSNMPETTGSGSQSGCQDQKHDAKHIIKKVLPIRAAEPEGNNKQES